MLLFSQNKVLMNNYLPQITHNIINFSGVLDITSLN